MHSFIYRIDSFIHFRHLGGCATKTRNGLPCGPFGATYAQVYGKYKVPFYNYHNSQDRHGKSVEPSQILQHKLTSFQV